MQIACVAGAKRGGGRGEGEREKGRERLLLACEQAFSRAGWGEGKAKRPVDRPLGPPFHGTRCASDPDASSHWREH